MNHDPGETCSCSPTVIPVERVDGSIGWVFGHHEPNLTPEQEVERAVMILQAMEDVRYSND